ncbi:MAG: thioredoxin family protein [Saprospiraceae bacterium]|nr:thioredoxin family protein [Saprospiraceae bacterium]
MKKVFALLTVVFAALTLSFQTIAPEAYGVGDKAADFNLKNVDGKNVSLAGIPNAKGYIVVFTCNHCPYAQAYEQRIIDLHKKYAPLGYPVVAINPNDKIAQPDDSFEKMQERAKDKAYPFVYLYDESQEVAHAFGATRTPHVYLLDNTKTVRYIGAIDDDSENPEKVKVKYLENAVDALLQGKPVEVTSTRAIGCSIKWAKK